MVKFDASLVSKLTKCKVLIRHGIGYDNVDVEACTKRGIVFAYQPDYCKEDVAEHAIALIFACARKVVASRRTLDKSSAAGQWDFGGLFPIHRMHGKTLGIVGVGRIGSRVYRKLQHFGLKIIGTDPYLSDQRKAEFKDLQWVDKKTLFETSDYITIHTPLNPETRHLVNAEALAWMKPTAYLVNTSRGPMVDAVALAKACAEKRIAGAAIDVFDVEPPPTDHHPRQRPAARPEGATVAGKVAQVRSRRHRFPGPGSLGPCAGLCRYRCGRQCLPRLDLRRARHERWSLPSAPRRRGAEGDRPAAEQLRMRQC
jgi:D-3-phosphoglycerate dehydrogenase